MVFKGANILTNAFIFYGRKIPNHPGKRRILYFCHRMFQDHIKVKSANGAVLQLIPVDYISGNILFYKTYEPISLGLALELLKETDGDFVDVGANVGLYTCIAASSFPGKQIIAIEPEETNFKMLTCNVAHNLPNRVNTVNVAVGQTEGVVQMESPAINNAGAFRVKMGEQTTQGEIKTYPMYDLSTIFKQYNITKVSLLKIDVEGYEMEVFKGIDWEDANKPQHIIMEYTDYIGRTGTTSDDVLEYLTKKGYKAYSVNRKPYIKGDELPEDNLWLSLS